MMGHELLRGNLPADIPSRSSQANRFGMEGLADAALAGRSNHPAPDVTRRPLHDGSESQIVPCGACDAAVRGPDANVDYVDTSRGAVGQPT